MLGSRLFVFASLVITFVACGDSSSTGGGGAGGGAATGGGVPDTCGNGVLDEGEACDGDDLGGETCITRGYPLGGTLSCRASDCSFDFGACHFVVCGNGELTDPEECDDGNTDDDDGCSSLCKIECGDGVCGPNENQCNCDADCHDANSCDACECGQPVADAGCGCDLDCVAAGNCCSDFTDVCGTSVIAATSMGKPIPDGAYDGTPESMACIDLPIAATGHVLSIDEIELAANHTFVGDLTIKLKSPSGTFVTLVSVPGLLEPSDTGGQSGDSSDLVAASPIRFVAGAATSAEAMGSTIGPTSKICAEDTICEYAPDAGAATPGDFASLVGESSEGTWQLCAGDGVPTDPGEIASVKLTMTVSSF